MVAKQHCRHYRVLYGACSKHILLQRSPRQAVPYCDRIVQRAFEYGEEKCPKQWYDQLFDINKAYYSG